LFLIIYNQHQQKSLKKKKEMSIKTFLSSLLDAYQKVYKMLFLSGNKSEIKWGARKSVKGFKQIIYMC